jgi:hypothetical protein
MVTILAGALYGAPDVKRSEIGDTSRWWGDDMSTTWADSYSYNGQQDHYGIPNFEANNLGMGVRAVGGTLVDINVQYDLDNGTLKYELLPGDLFLDTDTDYRWDYVVNSPFLDGRNYTGTVGKPSLWDVYAVDIPYLDSTQKSLYRLAAQTTLTRDGDSYQADWASVRVGQPYALATDQYRTAIGTAWFTGWLDGSSDNVITWKFDSDVYLDKGIRNPGIIPGKHNYVGFTVNCSNDEIWADVPRPTGVVIPEPASLLIWSVAGGLAAAGAAIRRRRPTRWSDENRNAIVGLIEKGRK